MLTLEDALERSGARLPKSMSSYRQKMIVPEHTRKIDTTKMDKKAELNNALNLVSRMRAAQNEQRRIEAAQTKLDEIKAGPRLGDPMTSNTDTPFDAVKKAQEIKKEIAEKKEKTGIQLPVKDEKPTPEPVEQKKEKPAPKTDEEIKESIRKANELNYKLGPKMGSDVSTEDLMNSVLNELF